MVGLHSLTYCCKLFLCFSRASSFYNSNAPHLLGSKFDILNVIILFNITDLLLDFIYFIILYICKCIFTFYKISFR